jgi:isoleucyl-tRNA synthetase
LLTTYPAYRLYTVVPRLLDLIDNTTNWYIRFNRQRLKGDRGLEETITALNVLFDVLYTISRSFAPFIPFLTDKIYLLLQQYMPHHLLVGDVRCVHFLPFPEPRSELFDEVVERRIARMQKVIELGRVCREKEPSVSLKQPLKTLTVLHPDQEYLNDLASLADYVKDELSIMSLVLSSDEAQYGVEYSCTVDWGKFGKKFRKSAKKLSDALAKLPSAEVKSLIHNNSIVINGAEISVDDVVIKREIASGTAGSENREINVDGDMFIILDKTLYLDLKDQRLGREIINRIQQLKKKAGLIPTDDIRIEYAVLDDPEDVGIGCAFETQANAIEKVLRRKVERYDGGPLSKVGGDVATERLNNADRVIIEEVQEVQNALFSLRISQL